ncbi:hypothetical protein MesoLj131c_06750 [Mesorhizobium sp. 131-3-5]|nr:hypothetical protein MesoLj131c_06750 [Mesorhizobium sp. 131-3-5]
MLAEHAGFTFNADILDRDRVIQALIDSFSGSEAPAHPCRYSRATNRSPAHWIPHTRMISTITTATITEVSKRW